MTIEPEKKGHLDTPTASATRSLLACATQVEFASQLIAPPTAYDAAPQYIVDAYRAESRAFQSCIINPAYERIAHRNRAHDLRIGLELVAPIGMGVVRTFALAGSMLAAASNPVYLVLAGPALFLTGKKLGTDIHRAFITDPKIRKLVADAQQAIEAGDHRLADRLYKSALDIDPSPTNKRNPDLYLHRGLLHIQMRKPRFAFVDFIKASVLIEEGESIIQTGKDGRKLSMSKRGMAEMLAVACIDSFASMDAGAGGEQEWREIIAEQSLDAQGRFERYATTKDTGRLFGLWGVDHAAAEANRAMAAKAHFLRAKNLGRVALLSAKDHEDRTAAIKEGCRLIGADPWLTEEERSQALLEQAQFYFTTTIRDKRVRLDHLDIALDLIDDASKPLAKTNPATAMFARAEALKFALAIVPQATTDQDGDHHGGDRANRLTERLERLVGDVEQTTNIDGADAYLLWAKDHLFRFRPSASVRSSIIAETKALAKKTNDLVALFHAALRQEYIDKRPFHAQVVVTAAQAMARHQDPVVAAFGSWYEAGLATDAIQDAYREAGRKFLVACEEIQSTKRLVPFYIQGHAIVHDWRESIAVCGLLSGISYMKARDWDAASGALDIARSANSTTASKETRQIVDVLATIIAAGAGDAASMQVISSQWSDADGRNPITLWGWRTWESLQRPPP